MKEYSINKRVDRERSYLKIPFNQATRTKCFYISCGEKLRITVVMLMNVPSESISWVGINSIIVKIIY